jgi:hypothetical protein
MTAFSVPLALFLAAVFAVSAIGKLRSSDRGRAGFDALQIRVSNPNAAAAALIIAEGVIAIALIVTTGWLFIAASTAALVLTVALLSVVVRAHRLGVSDDCGCFGDWLPAAIGPRLIARNVVLVVIAAALLLAALLTQSLTGVTPGVPHAFAAGPGSVSILGALIALLLIALATWSTARASADASNAAALTHGAGAVVIPSTAQIVDVLAPSTRARLLLFVSPGCHACATVLTHLREVEAQVALFTDVYVIQKVIHGALAITPDHTLPARVQFALDVGGSLGAVLDVGVARPVAALIGSDGTQAGPLALGSDEAILLIDSIVALAETPSA